MTSLLRSAWETFQLRLQVWYWDHFSFFSTRLRSWFAAGAQREMARAFVERLRQLSAGPRVLRHSVLTQVGQGKKFPREPRYGNERDVSVIDGAVSCEEAVRMTFDRPVRAKRDTIRLLDLELVAAEYRVYPTPWKGHDRHVSVEAPREIAQDVASQKIWWRDPARVTLDNVATRTIQSPALPKGTL